jgi:cobalamin biosynthesis Mg chelatase CobN
LIEAVADLLNKDTDDIIVN